MSDQDAELIEKMARMMCVQFAIDPDFELVKGRKGWMRFECEARAAISIARPVIEAQMREKAANTVAKMSMSEFFGRDGTRSQDNAANAIRSIPITGEGAE